MSHLARALWEYNNPFSSVAIKGQVQVQKTSQSGMDYVVYLPPNYDASRSYPLLYHFHGAGEILSWVKREVQWTARQLELCGVAMIVVAPHDATKFSMFENGEGIQMESLIQDELHPEIKAKFNFDQVYLQGFSMGGFGALAHGFKHAKSMGVQKIVVWDGALHDWETLSTRRQFIAESQFGNQKANFDVCNPWTAVELAAQENRLEDVPVLMFTGTMGETSEYGLKFKKMMEQKKGKLTHVETEFRHSMKPFIQGCGQQAVEFLLAAH